MAIAAGIETETCVGASEHHGHRLEQSGPGRLVAGFERVAALLERDAVHCYVSEQENALYVRGEFKDANALGFHLSQTAPKHFPQLLEIAVPGAFQFLGDVPAELQQATTQMGLAAEFSGHAFGFDR
jgi:hypothetical protein